MSDEQSIIAKFMASRRNKVDRCDAVNSLRHIAMDAISFDASSNDAYNNVYDSIMSDISSRFPPLGEEVKRQMEKKKRRQARRSGEEHKSELHIRL